MLLNSDAVVHYLLQRGILPADSVVDGELMVLETPRRNRNFKVTRPRQSGFFLKQVQEWDPHAMSTVQREAWCYTLARTLPELATLREMLPGLLAYDPQRHLLVLDLLTGFENLAEYHMRLRQFPVEIAVLLADVLGAYHRDTQGKLEQLPQASVFPRTVPWILSIHLQQPGWFQSISAANSQLLEIVKRYHEFSGALDTLRNQWNFNTLIHGDIKWDNCLVRPGGENEESELKIIDWEMADLGDPLWDAGAILQSYLVYWILSMPTWKGASAEDLISRAPYPLETVQAPLNAFWNRYKQAAGLPQEQHKQALARSIGYGAARMIQTAYETLAFAQQIHSNALYLLQVSMNILLSPQEAAGELFGIPEA